MDFSISYNSTLLFCLKMDCSGFHSTCLGSQYKISGNLSSLPQSPLELAESLEQLRWLENGYTIKVGISEIETIGIDTPADLEAAEAFLKNRTKRYTF
jgi:CMP-2-keto-3-deoxyoctulosonic acid synthetase